jgi:hypothetical protein
MLPGRPFTDFCTLSGYVFVDICRPTAWDYSTFSVDYTNISLLCLLELFTPSTG